MDGLFEFIVCFLSLKSCRIFLPYKFGWILPSQEKCFEFDSINRLVLTKFSLLVDLAAASILDYKSLYDRLILCWDKWESSDWKNPIPAPKRNCYVDEDPTKGEKGTSLLKLHWVIDNLWVSRARSRSVSRDWDTKKLRSIWSRYAGKFYLLAETRIIIISLPILAAFAALMISLIELNVHVIGSGAFVLRGAE